MNNTTTADLKSLRKAMDSANRKYAALVRKTRLPSHDSKEYVDAMEAYRAYWNAYDISKGRPARDA